MCEETSPNISHLFVWELYEAEAIEGITQYYRIWDKGIGAEGTVIDYNSHEDCFI